MKTETKVWIFLGLLSMFSLLFGYHFGSREGLFFAFVLNLCFWGLALTCDPTRVIRGIPSEEVTGRDPWGVLELTTKSAHQLSIKAPRVFFLDSDSYTAISWLGADQQNYLCISSSIFKKIEEKELQALLSYLICSISTFGGFFQRVGLVLSETILSLAAILDKFANRLILRKSNPLPIFQKLLSPIAWFFVRIFIKSRSFFKNDDIVAEMMTSRKTVARTLWKLDSLNQARPPVVPPCSAHFFAVSPYPIFENHWYKNPHPSLNLRMKRLIGAEYY